MSSRLGPRWDRLSTGVEAEPGAADLVTDLKKKLRDIELAQIAEAQSAREVVPTGRASRRGRINDIFAQLGIDPGK